MVKKNPIAKATTKGLEKKILITNNNNDKAYSKQKTEIKANKQTRNNTNKTIKLLAYLINQYIK